MKFYWIFAILILIFISGCIKQPTRLSLAELQSSLEPCGSEADRLSKTIEDPTISARRKVEICQQAIAGIEKCTGDILSLENEFSTEAIPETIEAWNYLEEVKHKTYVAGVLSKACTCTKVKEDFDSRIETDRTFSGKQILRVEKFCAMKENCIKLIEGTPATPAAEEEALRQFNITGLESPLLFFLEEAAKDFTAYCTDMLTDSDQKIASSQGEAREHLEIRKANQQLYCTGKALSDFDERFLPDWMTLLGRGQTQEASDTLEQYEIKYDIKFEGDEFNCPAIPFELDIVKKTSSNGSAFGCSRGVQDSCGAADGILNPVTCECQSKSVTENCETYASSFSFIGQNSTNINYAEGVQNGLSAEEACKSYAYQDILRSGFCNGKDQQLYAIYNKNNSCCARYWIESVNQLQIGSGGLFCGYKQRETNSGIWQKVIGTEENESLYHADWLGRYAFPSMGETCQDIEAQNGALIRCQ